jgi:hypothetical protein
MKASKRPMVLLAAFLLPAEAAAAGNNSCPTNLHRQKGSVNLSRENAKHRETIARHIFAQDEK